MTFMPCNGEFPIFAGLDFLTEGVVSVDHNLNKVRERASDDARTKNDVDDRHDATQIALPQLVGERICKSTLVDRTIRYRSSGSTQRGTVRLDAPHDALRKSTETDREARLRGVVEGSIETKFCVRIKGVPAGECHLPKNKSCKCVPNVKLSEAFLPASSRERLHRFRNGAGVAG